MPANNYVLGRGRVYIAPVDAVTKNPGQYRYVGITREFNLTAETEDLEHTSSEAGINEVDDRIQLSVTRTGTLTMEDTDPNNLALFFFGESESIAARGDDSSNQTWTISGEQLTQILADGYDDDNEIFIAATAANPIGVRRVKSANWSLAGTNSATSPAAVTLTRGTDWDRASILNGSFRLLNTAKTYGATGDAVLSQIVVTYRRNDQDAHARVVSGGTPFEGSLRFVEDNARGRNGIWTLPLMTLSPNGDLALKAEEWRQIPLSLSVQKPANAEAVYYNGLPA